MFWTVVLEKTLESPLDFKEIQPVNPKGNQPWIFIGRADAEAEAPVLWPPHGKNRFTGKDPDAGKDWGQGEKGTTEDEMAGWCSAQWTWVWADWEREKAREPGALWSMWSQRVRHDWVTEQEEEAGLTVSTLGSPDSSWPHRASLIEKAWKHLSNEEGSEKANMVPSSCC